MYSLGLQRDFIAGHYLIGGDWGPENDLHSHHYTVEVILTRESLDQHGYIVDLDDVAKALDECVALYQDKTLNDLGAFRDLNPSVERLAREICRGLMERLDLPGAAAVEEGQRQRRLLREASQALKTAPEELLERIAGLLSKLKEAKKEQKKSSKGEIEGLLESLSGALTEAQGLSFGALDCPALGGKELQDLAERAARGREDLALVLLGRDGGRAAPESARAS